MSDTTSGKGPDENETARWPFGSVAGGAGPAASGGPEGPSVPGPRRDRSGRPAPAAGAVPGHAAGPAAPDGDGDTPDGDGDTPDGDDQAPARRRPPLWMLIAAGVLVIGLVVAAVLVFGNDPEPTAAQQTLEAEVVTLPVPTPTVDPIAREAGTPFFEALPSTVLAYALSAVEPYPTMVAAGALEGHRLGYTDGEQDIVVVAGQWATAESAAAAYQAMVAEQTAAVAAAGGSDAGDATQAPDATSTAVEEGPVQVAGTEVGRYMLVPRGDGTGTVTWSNGTAVLQVDGPVESLEDVFTAFAL